MKAAIADVLGSKAPSKDKGMKASDLKSQVHDKEPSIKESHIDRVRNEMKKDGVIDSHGEKAKAVWFFKGKKK